MRISQTYQSRDALQLLRSLDVHEAIVAAITGTGITLERGGATNAKHAVESRLDALGWSTRLRIDTELRTEVNAFHPLGIALQVQLGNVARAFYDLMKLQRLYELGKISVGVLIVPMRVTARMIGSNLASFERLSEEHELMFLTQINVPLVIFGIS